MVKEASDELHDNVAGEKGDRYDLVPHRNRDLKRQRERDLACLILKLRLNGVGAIIFYATKKPTLFIKKDRTSSQNSDFFSWELLKNAPTLGNHHSFLSGISRNSCGKIPSEFQLKITYTKTF